MKIVDVILRPGTLLLLTAGGVAAGAAIFVNYSTSKGLVAAGLVLGVFVLASAFLIGAVIRRGQIQEKD